MVESFLVVGVREPERVNYPADLAAGPESEGDYYTDNGEENNCFLCW